MRANASMRLGLTRDASLFEKDKKESARAAQHIYCMCNAHRGWLFVFAIVVSSISIMLPFELFFSVAGYSPRALARKGDGCIAGLRMHEQCSGP